MMNKMPIVHQILLTIFLLLLFIELVSVPVYSQRNNNAPPGSACPLLVSADIIGNSWIEQLSGVVKSPNTGSQYPLTTRSIVSSLSRTTRSLLMAYPDTDLTILKDALTNDLNNLLKQPRIIFDKNTGLNTIRLSRASQSLLAGNPQGSNLISLNRFLLDDAYPRAIYQCTILNPNGTGDNNNGNGSENHTGEILLGVAAVAILADVLSHSHKHKSNENALMDDGPQVVTYTPFSFGIRGFVSGGWPLNITYQLDHQADVSLTIAEDGASSPYTIKLAGDTTEPKSIKIELPDNFGDKPKPGTIIVAESDTSETGTSPVHLHITGVSCGPGAVGSNGIQEIQFTDGSFSLKNSPYTTYSFGCLFPFQRVVADIVRISGNSHQTTAVRVNSKKIFDRTPAPILPEQIGPDSDKTKWNGKDTKKHKSLGLHELEVFGWQNSANMHSWSYGASENYISVKD